MKIINIKHNQFEYLLSMKHIGYDLIEILTDDDGNRDPYWIPLSGEDVAHVWLYPDKVNIIKN